MKWFLSLQTKQQAILALIVANIIWGAASPIFKLSLQNIPPFTLAFLRFFLGSILLIFVVGKKIFIQISSWKDLLLLVLNGLTGITINIIFFFLGLRLTYAINAPVIASAGPIVTFFFAVLFLREKLVLKKLVGMILGTLGILTIVFEPLLQSGIDGSILGNFFLVLAMLGAVLHTLTGRPLFQKADPLALCWWTFVIGFVTFWPLALYEYLTIPNLYTSLDYRGYLGIGFGAVLSTTVAYSLYAWGLSKISATDTAVFTYIDPVVGTILAYYLLHEAITAPFIIGALLIFGGIFLAEGRLHYHPLHKLKAD